LYELPGNGEISTELAQFLDEGDAPLLFTAGTANWHAKAFFEIALGAVQRLGKRALLLTQDRAQLPEHLPTGVCWQRYAPLAKVMPHVSAAVHHGGVGTMAEAFRAGVPQVVTPFAWDQFDNGARVVDLGVGRCVPVRKLSSPVLADKLADINSDSDVALACRRVSKLMQRQPDALQASRMVDAHWAADTFV
jgi:rhamnosyltransferase subunit B